MDEYESDESRAILLDALDRIASIIATARDASVSQDQRRDALNNIRGLIETAFNDYRREIGKVQKAELEALRAAAKLSRSS